MLHMALPTDCIGDGVRNASMFDSCNDQGKTQWIVNDLQPSKSVQITFDLVGDMADTFDPDDVYVSGINPVIVMGAEALPGDWGIKGMEITESEDADLIPDDDNAEEEKEELEEEDFEKEVKDDE
jgi:hypothetical protein